jgi:SAM-dependent methyltransferase
MYLDIVELREFYAGQLGRVARRLLTRRLRQRWPNVTGDVMVGLGYACPYLDVFTSEAETSALMPAGQGAANWPLQPPFKTALVDEFELPLDDGSVDRLLIVHALEVSEAPQALLREAWRVLAPGGRMMIVVSNRRGLWARVDSTPFGFGQPFSRVQLTRLLRDAMFSPVAWFGALHIPPFNFRLLLKSAIAWERIGRWLWSGFSGVIVVEATKQVFAPIPVGRRRIGRYLKPALEPSLGRTAALVELKK